MTTGLGRNGTLALLTLIYLFNFMDRQIMSVLAEPIKLELGLSDTQLGLLTGFMSAIFYTTFGVPVAWLADRTRRTWVIAGACTLWRGFCAACGGPPATPRSPLRESGSRWARRAGSRRPIR